VSYANVRRTGSEAAFATIPYENKGEAANLAAIIEALKTGGVKADEDTLRLSLSRSTWDVAKVGEDL